VLGLGGGERGRGMRFPRKEEARERIHDTRGSEGGRAKIWKGCGKGLWGAEVR